MTKEIIIKQLGKRDPNVILRPSGRLSKQEGRKWNSPSDGGSASLEHWCGAGFTIFRDRPRSMMPVTCTLTLVESKEKEKTKLKNKI